VGLSARQADARTRTGDTFITCSPPSNEARVEQVANFVGELGSIRKGEPLQCSHLAQPRSKIVSEKKKG